MYIVEQIAFDPLAGSHPGYRDPLVVHRRPGRANGTLAVFVHGLNGARYDTWAALPRYVFEDEASLDVGLYDYASGLRRLKRRESVDLSKWSGVLADTIRDAPYQRVVLIGHSMGGLLCKGAIMKLIDSQSKDRDGVVAVARVAGLFLFATPQAGSTRVPRWLSTLSKDARVLRAHSTFVTEVAQRFSDRVASRPELAATEDRILIRTYAVLGARDRWVDDLSAGLTLSTDQQKRVKGSHSSIVKPTQKSDEGYAWMLEGMRSCLKDVPVRAKTTIAASEEEILRAVARLLNGGIDLRANVDLDAEDRPT